MKRFKVSFLVLLFLAVSSSTGWASGWINGGRGLLHVKSAWGMQPGHMYLYAHTDFYGKVGEITDLESIAFWEVVGLVNLSYGLSNRFELGITPIIYEDTHKGEDGFDIPADLFVSLKMGSFGFRTSSLTFGLSLNSRFPTAKYHSLAFQPYSAGRVAWGFTGLMSYSLDPLYPDDDLNFHLNLGYLNHNDVGEKLSELPEEEDPIRVKSPTQELLYGLGLKLPTSEFDYGVEFFGSAFLQKPPETAFAREDYMYISPSVTYKPARWISFLFALDYRLTTDKDETSYVYANKYPTALEDVPNYPTWRVNLGVKFVILPTSIYRMSERDILMQRAESRRELFEQIIKERRQTESAEEELQRIKEERRKAERELERLRKILEDQAKRKEELEKLNEELPEPQPEQQPPPQF